MAGAPELPDDVSTAPPADLVAPGAELVLRVLCGRDWLSFTLPRRGRVIVGRSRSATDLRIDAPSISRRHAVIHIGDEVRIADLGSSNGTRVRDRSLRAGESVSIRAGDTLDFGSVLAVVQAMREPERRHLGDTAISMQRVQRLVERIAPHPISILLSGETGVGKEVMAETIHRLSPRGSSPFVKINCAALPDALLESELFGHEKGAFTGATQAKPGLLALAHQGTVFLDEIGELPTSLQPKLLRVVEERQLRPVGSLQARPIDVRLLSATNRDLRREIVLGRFRQDLYFRLAGIEIRLPPLRERVSEIAPLARRFVKEFAQRAGLAVPAIAPATLKHLEQHDWPGNIRELRQTIEVAVLLADAGTILPEHLRLCDEPTAMPARDDHDHEPATPRPVAPPRAVALKRTVRDVERQRIVDALDRCGGNQTRAARMLGISRATLRSRIVEFGLPRPRGA